FEKLMKDKFHMSSMGELTLFLGLQVQQKEDGIFISQDKYVAEILKKFNYTDVKSTSTPIDLEKSLVKDEDVDDVDVHLYRSMIRDSPFELVAYTNSDYAGATQDRKSTTGGCQFLGNRLISWLCKKLNMWLLDYGYNFMNIDNNNILTKGFDAGRFQYLVSSIGMLNP
ncbi:putative ribonuclease H-like domain-containing protein, partial [Tanacetum coccineum]